MIGYFLELIPDEHLDWLAHGRRDLVHTVGQGVDADVARFALNYKDVDLGFKLSKYYAESNKDFPSILDVDDEPLWRAYLYLKNPKRFYDECVVKAIGLMRPDFRQERMAIQSILLSKDLTPETIDVSYRDGYIDSDVVRCFERLFFNVLDRKVDAQYITRIVYPNTRMVEFVDGYIGTEDFGNLLMRAGYKNGVADVKELIGMGGLTNAYSAIELQTQLEALMMGQAFVMARNGWLNQSSNSTTLFHSRHLMTAAKLGGEESSLQGELSSLGDALMEEVLSYRRLDLQQEARETLPAGVVIDVESSTF